MSFFPKNETFKIETHLHKKSYMHPPLDYFFLQLYCGKEGKKVPCFHAGRDISEVKNFLKACNKKLLHTHSLYRQNF